jgi:biopolymer transport protein ExbB
MQRIRWALLLAVVAALLGTAATTTFAQDGASGPPPTPQADSFGGAFFFSRATSPTGETSIEWLGSLIIWFLLVLSVVSIGLIGNLALANQRKVILPEGVINEAKRLLAEGKFREAIELTGRDVSYFSNVLHAALSEAGHGFSAMIRRLEQTSDELTTMRLRRIEFLNVLGQVSPMIGLFGTVYGMILAFQAIVASGGTADPILLAGGIGTALTTTFWGLLVAIPALAGYAIVRNRIDELTTEATLLAEEIVNGFRSRPATAHATSTGAAPSPSAAQPSADISVEAPKPRPVRRTTATKSGEADSK